MTTTSPSAWLIINSQVFPLSKEVTKIGRKLENDIVFQEILVSRFHAEIHFKDREYTLYDLGSTDGTYLNNQQIQEAHLHANDLISIANIPIMFIQDKKVVENFGKEETDSLDK